MKIKPRYKVTRATIELKPGEACHKNWPLEISVEALSPDIDPNIFVFHAGTDKYSQIQGDMFSNVASLQDMNIIPAEEPKFLEEEDGTENNIPYYRLAEVKLDFYNMQELEEQWRKIKHHIELLTREYAAQNILSNKATFEL